MILDVSHKTTYRYEKPVVHSQHVVHMTPRAAPGQRVRHHSLIVEPAPTSRTEIVDPFGNTAVMIDIESPHKELVLLARSSVERSPPSGLDVRATSPWDRLDRHLSNASGGLALDVIQFRSASRYTMPTREIADFAATMFSPGRPVLDGVMALTEYIFRQFRFDPTASDVSTPITKVFRERRGVCQDFAHLSLACLRAMRIPARYVSGYILTRPPPGQPKLQGADASHAWISVWAPETGWVDFDPTNGLIVSDEHATIAFGRDYADVSPISGVLLGGGDHTVSVGVDVAAEP